jgi:hypothetical protein
MPRPGHGQVWSWREPKAAAPEERSDRCHARPAWEEGDKTAAGPAAFGRVLQRMLLFVGAQCCIDATGGADHEIGWTGPTLEAAEGKRGVRRVVERALRED